MSLKSGWVKRRVGLNDWRDAYLVLDGGMIRFQYHNFQVHVIYNEYILSFFASPQAVVPYGYKLQESFSLSSVTLETHSGKSGTLKKNSTETYNINDLTVQQLSTRKVTC